MSLSPLTDEQLLARIAQRDQAALEAFYARHAQVVYSLVLRMVREVRAAEEVLQESFWQLWQAAGSAEAGSHAADGAAAAWLYQIARAEAREHLRRTVARPVVTGDEAAAVELPIELRARAEQVRAALAQLPEEQRTCLELAYFEDMSQRQIAKRLALPLDTVKTQLRLGVETLAGPQRGNPAPDGQEDG